jgi:phosphoribosylformimino-5-aminoimidazole carboxamide ribonucleotide (ProFAR) isomerase
VTANTLTLLPAVDVRDGQAVRLVKGASGSETSYGEPLAAALAWQQAGAEWIHLVDLDAAFGTGDNRALLAEVTGRLDVKVELSGGIRDDESLRAALATGCARVNLGTAALESPAWVAKGCARYVVTDVDKDGTLTGPNLQLLRNVCAATDRAVVASGGVSSLQDLRDIATLVPEGVEGAIVGKALYAQAFTLEEALAAVS